MIQCPDCKSWPKGDVCVCGKVLREVKIKAPGIKKISLKQKLIQNEAKKIHKEMAKSHLKICSGCYSKKCLTHSHLIPRSQRPLLQNIFLNQVYHCMECHYIWEHDKQARKKLRDYNINMEKIKMLDIGYYNLIIGKHGL